MEKYNIKLLKNVSGLLIATALTMASTVLKVPDEISDEKAVDLIKRGLAEPTDDKVSEEGEQEDLRKPKSKKIKTDLDLINQDKKGIDDSLKIKPPDKLTEEALKELENKVNT